MSQQTSRKMGLKSSGQKEAYTRQGTEPMPATQHTPGAFGKESPENIAEAGSAAQNKEPALEQRADQLDESDVANA